jgi:Dyp-type peroxidase family
MIAQKGKYNPFNKWNNRKGIMHLSQPANYLEAEIILGAQATVIRQRADATVVTDPNELILSSQYGNPGRFSDPKIGSDVNTIARAGLSVSISNPVALYMHSIDPSAFEFPKGYEFSDFWKVQRGDPAKNMILRAEFSAPKGSRLDLEAIKVAGLPLKYGGQMAQYISMVIYGLACDLSKPKQKPSTGLTEDLLEIKKIQANIAPGFKLPFQSLVGVKVPAIKTGARLIEQVLPKITPMSTAIDYHQRRVSKAKETRQFGLMSYELVEKDFFWLNLAFGRHFIKACPHVELTDLGEAFSQGMNNRSALLGDPMDPKSPGSNRKWKAGAKDKEADIFFICAAPDALSLQNGTNWLLAEIKKAGAKVLYQEKGERLADEAEHFGFKDGISQPELRGLVSSDPNPVFFAERKFSKGNDDDYQPEFSAPGDILIWPGQFIFGYSRQSGKSFRQPDAADQMKIKPSIKNGSFLAYRRLNQDVAGFYQKTDENAKMFAQYDSHYNDPDYLRSKIVGRFKDGQSLLFDTPVPNSLTNHFAFSSPLPAMTLKDGQTVHNPAADPLAAKCPFFAHTRKVNPRDAATNFGTAADSLKFRILRRGISFGPPYDHQNPASPNNKAERGLLFLSYQTSLEDQFEFLLNNWVNSPINPEDGKGYDLLVGQNNGNPRFAELTVGQTTQRLEFIDAYITPTGGEYFFVPSIELLHLISGSTMQRIANKR